MSTQESGSGGTYAYSQSVIATLDTISAAGSFASSFTLPANSLKPGVVVRVTFHGVYTTTSTASPLYNVSLQASAGGGAAADVLSAAASNTTLSISQTNGGFGGYCTLVCQTAGASGTWEAQGAIWSSTVAGATTWINSPQAAAIAVDTTKTQALTLKIPPTLVGGQTYTLRSMIVEVL